MIVVTRKKRNRECATENERTFPSELFLIHQPDVVMSTGRTEIAPSGAPELIPAGERHTEAQRRLHRTP